MQEESFHLFIDIVICHAKTTCCCCHRFFFGPNSLQTATAATSHDHGILSVQNVHVLDVNQPVPIQPNLIVPNDPTFTMNLFSPTIFLFSFLLIKPSPPLLCVAKA